MAQIGAWEQAHWKEEAARNKAKKAKRDYENTITQAMFGLA
jgi:hypothetical protein